MALIKVTFGWVKKSILNEKIMQRVVIDKDLVKVSFFCRISLPNFQMMTIQSQLAICHDLGHLFLIVELGDVPISANARLLRSQWSSWWMKCSASLLPQ